MQSDPKTFCHRIPIIQKALPSGVSFWSAGELPDLDAADRFLEDTCIRLELDSDSLDDDRSRGRVEDDITELAPCCCCFTAWDTTEAILAGYTRFEALLPPGGSICWRFVGVLSVRLAEVDVYDVWYSLPDDNQLSLTLSRLVNLDKASRGCSH